MHKLSDKITRGPWAWQKFGNYRNLVAKHGEREIIIGSLAIKEAMPVETYPAMNKDGILKPVDDTYPNAKVIAASPEMVILLEKLALSSNTAAWFECKNEANELLNKLNS